MHGSRVTLSLGQNLHWNLGLALSEILSSVSIVCSCPELCPLVLRARKIAGFLSES